MRHGRSVVWVGRPILAIALLLGLVPAAGSASMAAAPPFEIRLQVETPAYRLDAGGLTVAGYGCEDQPGAPMLPVWATLVELPAAGEPLLSYDKPNSRRLAVTRVLPAVPVPQIDPAAPAGLTDLPDAPVLIDRPDPVIYARDAFYPVEPVMAGPVQWQRGKRLLPVRVYPFQYNPISGELRYHPDLRLTVRIAGRGSADELEGFEALGLSAGVASPGAEQPDGTLRILTAARGLYRLTYDDLVLAGVPISTTSPTAFTMSYLGQPIAIEVRGSDDSRFDPGDQIVFYAEPYVGRYMTHNVYQFSYGGVASSSRMAQRTAPRAGDEPVVTAITQTVHIEVDRSYYSTYHLPRDADHWFDDPLYANAAAPVASVSYGLPLDDPLPTGDLVVRAALHGGAARSETPDQSVALAFNGHALGTFQWDDSVSYLATATVPAAWLTDAINSVSLTSALDQLPGLDGYWVSPDWVEVTYPARAEAEGDRLVVEAVAAGPKELIATGFSTAAVAAYDVSDARHPAHLTEVAAQPDGAGGYTVHLWDDAAPGRSYVLSSDAALLPPLAIQPDAPSVWRSPAHTFDYIAIVHRSLWDAVQPLLDHRAAEGLRVARVDVQDVYDEFSAGRVDPEAIRDFLVYAYHHWNAGAAPPRFVLLVGDGHYDFKGAQRPDLPNLIPPYLLDIDPWIGETAADNRYVSVDGPDDYLPDMAIGRIPAKAPADVAAVVAKVIAYETAAPVGDWQRRVVFAADDYSNPSGNFHALSDDVRLGWLPSRYEGRPVYYRYDAAHDTGAEMRAAIADEFNKGALLLQWYGHASRQRWGSVSMFDVLDPPKLAATTSLPFTAHYACWSGYFINIQGSRLYGNSELALGEALLLAPGRGALADLSPSGLHVGDALLVLNRGLIAALLGERAPRIGDAVNSAKTFYFSHSATWHDLLDTSILLGDPATRLHLPPISTYLPLALAAQ